MKSEQVLAAFRAFLNGNRDEAISFMRQIEATESRNHNGSLLAGRIRRLYEQGGSLQMIQLPQAPSEITAINPQRDLASVILSDRNREIVAKIVREWKCREALAEHGLAARNVLMLCGPSGNGKTCLAEAIAKELTLPFALVNYGNLIASYIGATSKGLGNPFAFIQRTPVVLLFDEADSIVSSRQASENSAGKENARIVNSMLIELDRMSKLSCVIFATNMREELDPALSRRITAELVLGAPCNGERQAMISAMSSRWPFIAGGSWVKEAESAESFAKIESLAMDAARDQVVDRSLNTRSEAP